MFYELILVIYLRGVLCHIIIKSILTDMDMVKINMVALNILGTDALREENDEKR